jgi:HlyD family secretion protein
MKKAFKIAIIGAVMIAVVGVGYLRLRPMPASAAASVPTATVQRTSLSATVNTAGNIQSHQSVDLTFGQSGTVKKIAVKVGDRVKAGDVLAELEPADLNLQLRSAQVNLKNAQDQLAKTKNPNTEQDVANARAQLESAQAAYDKVVAGASQAKLTSAQAQVASAQAAYDAAVKSAGTSDSSLVSVANTFEKARIALEKAQGDYDKVSWRGDVGATSQASSLQSATIDYNSAKANYDALAATAKTDTNSKIASAAASLRSAQANLDELKNQVTAADQASAQAALTQAKNNLVDLLAGPDANSLDIAQNGVETAQIAVDQIKLKLQQAQVVAPFDGIVTTINSKIGQSASGTAISMADLDHLDIIVNMAEVDVNKVKLGQPAEITLDAVTDLTLAGAVSQIAPAGVQSSGVVNYPVTVALTKTLDSVKTGMTANVNIIIAQRNDVLTVPNRAVRTVGKQKTVTVLFEGQQIQTPVQVGLSGDSTTEIVSGLKEGDVVVVTTTTTKTTTGGGGMGIPGAGGPPPGM